MKELDESGTADAGFQRKALQPRNQAGRSDVLPGRVEDRDRPHRDAAARRRTRRRGLPRGAPELQRPVGAPQENPFSSLIAMYLVAEEKIHGVLVKLPGAVSLNPKHGPDHDHVRKHPAAPVLNPEARILRHRSRAARDTGAVRDLYDRIVVHALVCRKPRVPEEIQHPSSAFQISSGPEVQTASGPQKLPCSDPAPFNPTLVSDTTNIQAGAFSPLETTLGREDGNQQIQQVTLHYPRACRARSPA